MAACKGLPPAKMIVIKPIKLEDVFGDVVTIATALGVPARGVRLVEHLKQRMEGVDPRVSARRRPPCAYVAMPTHLTRRRPRLCTLNG